jgi:hypothetical protein
MRYIAQVELQVVVLLGLLCFEYERTNDRQEHQKAHDTVHIPKTTKSITVIFITIIIIVTW